MLSAPLWLSTITTVVKQAASNCKPPAEMINPEPGPRPLEYLVQTVAPALEAKFDTRQVVTLDSEVLRRMGVSPDGTVPQTSDGTVPQTSDAQNTVAAEDN